jgi:hypothetical protein
MKKWEIVLHWRRQLKEWCEYDNSLGGTIAELYSNEELGHTLYRTIFFWVIVQEFNLQA